MRGEAQSILPLIRKMLGIKLYKKYFNPSFEEEV